MASIKIKEVVKALNLDIISGESGIEREVSNQSISKPGIELAGMFDFYERDRIQLIGSKESTYLKNLSEKDQRTRVNKLFEMDPPAFIFSKNVVVPKIFIEFSEQYKIPVLKSYYTTSSLFSELYDFLQSKLADRTSMHGVLMDINGVGVFISGKSGVGKSEVALELIRRGYILVADDLVEMYQLEKGVVIGEAPDMLKRYLEIRGVGIVNVVYLFGVKAYRTDKKISLIVELEKWDKEMQFDRLGLNEEHRQIFDTNIAYTQVPITEARNAATLIEAAAYHYKAKLLGFNSADEFNTQLNEMIEKNQKKDRSTK